MQHSINLFLIRWENYVYNFYFFVLVSSGCVYIVLHLQLRSWFFSHREESLLMGKLNPQMQSQNGTVKMRKKKNWL